MEEASIGMGGRRYFWCLLDALNIWGTSSTSSKQEVCFLFPPACSWCCQPAKLRQCLSALLQVRAYEHSMHLRALHYGKHGAWYLQAMDYPHALSWLCLYISILLLLLLYVRCQRQAEFHTCPAVISV